MKCLKMLLVVLISVSLLIDPALARVKAAPGNVSLINKVKYGPTYSGDSVAEEEGEEAEESKTSFQFKGQARIRDIDKAIEVDGDYVVFNLAQPFPPFLGVLAGRSPSHMWDMGGRSVARQCHRGVCSY